MPDKIKNLLELAPDERANLMISLLSKGISGKVLDVMKSIPREYFISSEHFAEAYHDKPLPIDNGQTISQPYTVGFMTDLLEVKPSDKILEIGTGSGYQALILFKLGAKVYSVERIQELFDRSVRTFFDFGCNGIHSILGDGSLGAPEYAPFDKIIVTAASPKVPQELKNQLSTGGIMVIPVGSRESQTMLKIKKINDSYFEKTEYSNFRFVPLIGSSGWNTNE
ncbi:protein-L-isoaspartate(D-aspartate) O-methyltransferase [Candidatus Kapaibacterium sp.]